MTGFGVFIPVMGGYGNGFRASPPAVRKPPCLYDDIGKRNIPHISPIPNLDGYSTVAVTDDAVVHNHIFKIPRPLCSDF